MLTLSTDQQAAFCAAVRDAAGRAELLSAIDTLYADLQAAIDARKPLCTASGRCCKFESYGHRLFISTAETAHFAAAHAVVTGGGLDLSGWDGVGCPLQVGKLCGVHGYRPFGCRMFFCDSTSDDWQHEHYEQFHTRLKALHERFGVPYYYVEWRAALRVLAIPPLPE